MCEVRYRNRSFPLLERSKRCQFCAGSDTEIAHSSSEKGRKGVIFAQSPIQKSLIPAPRKVEKVSILCEIRHRNRPFSLLERSKRCQFCAKSDTEIAHSRSEKVRKGVISLRDPTQTSSIPAARKVEKRSHLCAKSHPVIVHSRS